jgi:NHLM bacteriocin system ABC transporter peptidase/ATP-binding protein
MTVVADSPASTPTRLRTGRRAKVPTVLQMQIADCGAASLGMILAHHGRWETLDELREVCGVSRDGSSAVDILRAADHFGLESHGTRVVAGQLEGMAMPVIVWWDRSHFLVLEGAKRSRVHLNDPASGRRTITVDQFVEHFSGAVLTFAPTDRMHTGGERPGLRRSLSERLRRSRWGLALAIAAGTLAAIPTLALALLAQLFVDAVLGVGDRSIGSWIALATFIAVLTQVLVVHLQYRTLAALQQKLATVGTVSLLERLLQLPLSAYFLRGAGDLASRMTGPAALAQTLSGQVGAVAVGAVSIFIYAIAMFVLDWHLALIVVGLALGALIVMWRGMKVQRASQEVVLQAEGRAQGVAVQTIVAIESVKAAGATDQAFDVWIKPVAAGVDAERRTAGVASILGIVPAFVNAATAALVLVVGAILLYHGTISIGDLLAIQILAASFGSPVQQLLSSAVSVQQGMAQLRRIDDIVGQPIDPRFESNGVGRTTPGSGQLELRNVTFGYRRTSTPLIRSVSFEVEPGGWLALVGASGAGKTTIGRLASGLVTPWSGEVLLDGSSISEWDPDTLAVTLATVEQQVVLFAGTVRDNVTLWDDTVDDERVIRALHDAAMLRDVLARPGGLGAPVLDGGRNFSGGQRQRIGLARALVRDPSLLVLDEATSSLDPLTEVEVMENVRRRGCSVLVIAHRLSTVRDADEILCLGRGGRLLERGTHSELMASGGWYAESVAASGDGGIGV